MQAQMLAPAAVLIAWSLVMLFWMAGARGAGMRKMQRGLAAARPGGRGQDLEGVLDDRVNWKAHNYMHLMEQPTIFYPAVIILAILGAAPGDVLMGWIYVGLRIAHSVWQATVNTLPVRFTLFLLSTLALIYLAARCIAATVFAGPTVLA
ncbi:MAPEG family protein [Erythrobacteraceae bacterium CFH 75059]|uniref:MAPEG family protein n=1 Tax=Qipengyuania thermophila TaxID=2509361 RepID=UPI00101EB121|nr:MAPEG family protein [Qipengyuania thermophila]TCD02236.1 MAPEG family protein [Erythrobacteraceae bacterium CFH 75059]